MTDRIYHKIVSYIFLVIAAVHLIRALDGWEAVINGVSIPLWVSWAAVLIALYLALRGFSYAKK